MGVGDILDIVLIGGAVYLAFQFMDSPLGEAVKDLAGFAESVITNNVDAVQQLSQGNTAGAYESNCKAGFNPYRPDCAIYNAVKDTIDVGAGEIPILETCPAGWNNDGLTCREPIDTHGSPWAWEWTGGRVIGRLDNQVCPAGKESVDGLCYSRCPASHPLRVSGMPYLCSQS